MKSFYLESFSFEVIIIRHYCKDIINYPTIVMGVDQTKCIYCNKKIPEKLLKQKKLLNIVRRLL